VSNDEQGAPSQVIAHSDLLERAEYREGSSGDAPSSDSATKCIYFSKGTGDAVLSPGADATLMY